MKINDIILEVPLPSDWDTNKFDKNNTSYKDMINYAKERSQQVGVGSSRIAFNVPYQGRKTIIKVAKNSKGIAQNKEEINLLNDGYVMQLDITIPIIDHDTNESSPTWIHTEFADKISNKQLDKFFGYPLDDMLDVLDYQSRGNRSRHISATIPDEAYENEYFESLRDLVVGYDIPVDDLRRKANWGIYKGNPVIIDLGLTLSTIALYS